MQVKIRIQIDQDVVQVKSKFETRMLFQCTHSCSPAAGRCHSNQACSSGRRGLRCGTSSADTRQFGRRRNPGPTCRCCCCTDRAGIAPPPHWGFHSNQVSIRHSEHLERTGEDGWIYRHCTCPTKTLFSTIFMFRHQLIAAFTSSADTSNPFSTSTSADTSTVVISIVIIIIIVINSADLLTYVSGIFDV